MTRQLTEIDVDLEKIFFNKAGALFSDLLWMGITIDNTAFDLVVNEKSDQSGKFRIKVLNLKSLGLNGDQIYPEEVVTAAWKLGLTKVPLWLVRWVLVKMAHSPRIVVKKSMIFMDHIDVEKDNVLFLTLSPYHIGVRELKRGYCFNESDNMYFLERT